MKKILITGAGGFIGGNLSRFLSDMGFGIFSIDMKRTRKKDYEADYRQITLPDIALEEALDTWQPDICIHCAGSASVGLSVTKPASDFSSSLPATFQLLDAIKNNTPNCKVIFISSAAVYGNPTTLPIAEDHPVNPISPYGYHKLLCEKLCEEFYNIYKIQVLVVRIFSAYGFGLKRQVVWDICKKFCEQERTELFGDGTESRDFIHVNDICQAINILISKGSFDCGVYNLASGVETTISQLSRIIQSAFGYDKAITFTGRISHADPRNWVADISRIKKLGFSPEVTLESAIVEYVENYKKTKDSKA